MAFVQFKIADLYKVFVGANNRCLFVDSHRKSCRVIEPAFSTEGRSFRRHRCHTNRSTRRLPIKNRTCEKRQESRRNGSHLSLQFICNIEGSQSSTAFQSDGDFMHDNSERISSKSLPGLSGIDCSVVFSRPRNNMRHLTSL